MAPSATGRHNLRPLALQPCQAAVVLVWLLAGCRGQEPETEATSSKTEASKIEASKTQASETEAAVDREAWASSCAESLIPTTLPPPPPPAALPERAVTEIAAATGPGPEDAAKPEPAVGLVELQRPSESELATRIGLATDACEPPPLVALLDEHQKDESLYCAIAFAFEQCGRLDQALVWLERRAADFPGSADARLALGWWRFQSLLPSSPMQPTNYGLSSAQRLASATAVVADAEAALALRANDAAAHRLAYLAHIQKSFARELVTVPKTVEDQLEMLANRKDMMAAWEHADAEKQARGVPECSAESVEECRPSLQPLIEDMAADAELEARLLAQLEQARRGQ